MVVDLHAAQAGEGPPLVLLHAFPLSSVMWTACLGPLSEVCQVITPDLRGFGRSPLGADPPSLDRMADDVAALLDARGIDTAVVGGLSMGGYVTMALLRRHPQRIRAVVLADTRAQADTPEGRANRERIATVVERERSARVLLDEVVPTLLGGTTQELRPGARAAVHDMVAGAPPAAVAWAQRAMADRTDSFGTLRAVDVPSLVLVGDEDTLTPPSDSEAMVGALAGARMVRIPAAGHLSAVEAPEAFAAAVRDFVVSLRPTPAP